MTPNEYQQETRRTRRPDSPERQLEEYALGLCGESGELGELVKKHAFYGHKLQRSKLIEEAGDAMFYLASLLDLAGVELSKPIGTYVDGIPDPGIVPLMVRNARELAFKASECGVYAERVIVLGERWAGSVLFLHSAAYLRRLRDILKAAKVTLEEVMVANVEKRRVRFPNGFTAADADARKDEA